MPAAAAPTAAAPAAKPSAPAAPSPSPAAPVAPPSPAEAGEAALEKSVQSVSDELYQMDDGKPANPPQKPAGKSADKPEGDETPEPPPADKPAGDAKPEGRTADELLTDAKEPGKIHEVRQAYRTLKAAVKTEYKPTIERLEARVKELESAAPQSGEIVKQFEAEKQRVQELESQIEFLDFSRSKTFQEKYEQPYVDAWKRALGDFQRLRVKVAGPADEQSGEPTFTMRQATQEDLLSLANMDLSEMDAKAHEMFGLSAPRVIAHVEKVRDLAVARENAIAQAQKTSSERRKAAETERTMAQSKRNDIWQSSNKELVTKYRKMFGEVPEDAPGNELLKKGRLEAEKLFNPTEANRFATPEEAIKGHALMWHKIANHDRLVRWLKGAKAEISELKKALAEFERSEPPGGKGGGGTHTPSGDPAEEIERELRALDK
jgi:hypothetical protein